MQEGESGSAGLSRPARVSCPRGGWAWAWWGGWAQDTALHGDPLPRWPFGLGGLGSGEGAVLLRQGDAGRAQEAGEGMQPSERRSESPVSRPQPHFPCSGSIGAPGSHFLYLSLSPLGEVGVR